MTAALKKSRFTHCTLLIGIISTGFLANLKSTVAQDSRQNAVLHRNRLPIPDPVPFGESLETKFSSNLAAFQFDNVASSVCVTGIQIFYENRNFNAQRGLVEYVYWPTNRCENLKFLRRKVSSARYAGIERDFLASALNMYQWDYFQGEQELMGVDRPTLNLDGQVGSMIVTGKSPWTLYSQPNYTGEAVCVRGEYPTPAFIYDVTKMGISQNFVRSVRRGCFATPPGGGGGGYPSQTDLQNQQGQGLNQYPNENQIQNLIQDEILKQVSGLVQSPSPSLTSPGPAQTNYPSEAEIQNLIQTEIAKQVLALMQSQAQIQMPAGTATPNYPNEIQIQALIQTEIGRQIQALQQAQNQMSNVISAPSQSSNPNPNSAQISSLSESEIQALVQTEIQSQVQVLKQLQDQMSMAISGQGQSPIRNPAQNILSESEIQGLIQAEIQKQIEALKQAQQGQTLNDIPGQSSTSIPAENVPSESQIQALIQTEIQKQVEALKQAQQGQMSNDIPGQSANPNPAQNVPSESQIQALVQMEIQKQVEALKQAQQDQMPNGYPDQSVPSESQIQGLIQSEIQKQFEALAQAQGGPTSNAVSTSTSRQLQNGIQSEIQNQVQALIQAQNQNENLSAAQSAGSQVIDPTQIQILIQNEIQNQVRDIIVSQNRRRFEQSNLFPREGARGFSWGAFPSSIRNPFNFLSSRLLNFPFGNNRLLNNNF